MSSKQPASLPLVDVLKAVASQLIVWHHLAFYGPMSDTVHPHAGELIDWLYNHARLAVQVFLVVGGFLAARALFPRADEALRAITPREGLALVWRRYVRLGRPYLLALVLATGAGWLARSLVDHASNPKPVEALQFLVNATMLQDVLGVGALSAGVWYVAIDLQLYALMIVLCMAATGLGRFGVQAGHAFVASAMGLAAASLFWINLDPGLDVWAPYFFGAYGMGLAAQWISTQPRKAMWVVLLGIVVLAALGWEWRSRILVAGVTALLLATCPCGNALQRLGGTRVVPFLSRISYAVFLVHYPVLLVVGSFVHHFWPGRSLVHAAGLVLAWLLSLAAAALLHRWVETPRRVAGASLSPRKQFHPFEAFGHTNHR